MDEPTRRQIESELRANGFIDVDGLPYTPTQIALLTWYKLDELSAAVGALETDRITRKEVMTLFEKQRAHLFRVAGLLVSMFAVGATLLVTLGG